MGKADEYRRLLGEIEDWEPFLLRESGLPGRRANLELLQAVADLGSEALFRRFLGFDPDRAPTDSPGEFLAMCGVVGLGRLLAEGRGEMLETLRRFASDPRWRVREGVAMALQRLGEVDMDALLREMEVWSEGNFLEQRAAAAALCEPRLLGQPDQVEKVLQVLDRITASVRRVEARGDGAFRTLRKGLGYCWSVAVAAYPERGKGMMERWFSSSDADVLWIMRQNLNKKRMARMDAEWVERWKRRLPVRPPDG